MAGYAACVERGSIKDIDDPFEDVVAHCILGSDQFIDWITREFLLLWDGSKGGEPSLFGSTPCGNVSRVLILPLQLQP